MSLFTSITEDYQNDTYAERHNSNHGNHDNDEENGIELDTFTSNEHLEESNSNDNNGTALLLARHSSLEQRNSAVKQDIELVELYSNNNVNNNTNNTSNNSSTATLSILPEHILSHIFEFLPRSNRTRIVLGHSQLSQVSTAWHSAISHDIHWRDAAFHLHDYLKNRDILQVMPHNYDAFANETVRKIALREVMFPDLDDDYCFNSHAKQYYIELKRRQHLTWTNMQVNEKQRARRHKIIKCFLSWLRVMVSSLMALMYMSLMVFLILLALNEFKFHLVPSTSIQLYNSSSGSNDSSFLYSHVTIRWQLILSFIPLWLTILCSFIIVTLYLIQAIYKTVRYIYRDTHWRIFHPFLYGYVALILISITVLLVELNVAVLPYRIINASSTTTTSSITSSTSSSRSTSVTMMQNFIPWYLVVLPIVVMLIAAMVHFSIELFNFVYMSYYIRKGRRARCVNWWFLVILLVLFSLLVYTILMSVGLELHNMASSSTTKGNNVSTMFATTGDAASFVLQLVASVVISIGEIILCTMFLIMLMRDQCTRFAQTYHLVMYLIAIMFGPAAIISHLLQAASMFIGASSIFTYALPLTLAFVFGMMLLFEEQHYT